MRITKTQLKNLVKEVVKKQLDESLETQSQKDYHKLQGFRQKYGSLLQLAGKLSTEDLTNIFDRKAEANDYNDFFKAVGPGEYDRNQGRFTSNNNFNLRPEQVRKLWDLEEDSKDVIVDFDQYQSLKDRFVSKLATTHVDAMYGRKRMVVIDTHTGEVVTSAIDRKGSLGT